MSELAEPVAIALAAVAPTKDGPCWYCEEPPEESRKNDEQADPDTSDSESEDAVPENDETNCSSKLGTKLGGTPHWSIDRPGATDPSPTRVIPGAHHCIPGNASLAKATELHDFMRQGGPFNLASDIGYDVNGRGNGVWLPANYGVRPGNDSWTRKWSSFDKPFKDEYAKRAMAVSKSQFHDAHPKYNGNVLKTLRSMAEKLGEPEDKCPVCKKKFDKTRPPFGLVGRLNFVSAQHRDMLVAVGERTKKFVRNGYFTSSRVKTFLGIE